MKVKAILDLLRMLPDVLDLVREAKALGGTTTEAARHIRDRRKDIQLMRLRRDQDLQTKLR